MVLTFKTGDCKERPPWRSGGDATRVIIPGTPQRAFLQRRADQRFHLADGFARADPERAADDAVSDVQLVHPASATIGRTLR